MSSIARLGVACLPLLLLAPLLIPGALKKGHRLLHCWSMDHTWTILGVLGLVTIIVLYGLIAARGWHMSLLCQTEMAKKHYRLHTMVFVLCGLSGYGAELLAAFDMNFYRLRVATLWGLAGAALFYLLRNWNMVLDARTASGGILNDACSHCPHAKPEEPEE